MFPHSLPAKRRVIAGRLGFGHFVDGLSWTRLLSDYDLSEGRLLLLLWLVGAAGPFPLVHLRQRRAVADAQTRCVDRRRAQADDDDY